MNKFISFQVMTAMIFFAITGCNKDKPESDATGNIPVIQSYILTTARYNYNVYEKRILYRIVEMIRMY